MLCRAMCVALTLLLCGIVFAQELTSTATSGQGPVQAQDQFDAQVIPRNSRVFISRIDSPNNKRPLERFESYLAAAIRKKNVPIIMVTDRSQADFEIVGTAESRAPGWEQKIFGEFRETIYASISVVNIRTGVVAYADSSYREAANRGPRSSAEKLAKYLKKKIEDDEKRILKGK